MEVSTQPNSSNFGYYGSYESGPSYASGSCAAAGCFEYRFDDESMGYDDYESTGQPSTASFCDADSEQSESEFSITDEPMEESNDYCNKSEALELAASTEMLRIRFPYQSITIRLSDFCCLQDQDLLNDTIVDFYLNHIVEHILPDDPMLRVTVLPAVFWHNLSILQSYDPRTEGLNLTERQLMDARFGDVLEFVEGFDLLDVDYIVVPINEWEHWSLAIICHPFTDRCKIVCFDSQLTVDHNNLQHISEIIDEFMKYAWLRWRGEILPSSLPCIIPKNLAQQTNNFDCGVYILEFARRFLLAPPKKLDNFDFSDEYADFSVASARTSMQKAVLSLCSNRSLWNPLLELLKTRN